MNANARGSGFSSGERTAGTFASSGVLGSAFGLLACMGMDIQSMDLFALFFGGIVGVISSPALLFGLRYGPWLTGLIYIAVPTAVAAFLAGAFFRSNNPNPLITIPIAVGVYVLASVVRGMIGLKHYGPRPKGVCTQCGYDRAGLAPIANCPECGAPAPRKASAASGTV